MPLEVATWQAVVLPRQQQRIEGVEGKEWIRQIGMEAGRTEAAGGEEMTAVEGVRVMGILGAGRRAVQGSREERGRGKGPHVRSTAEDDTWNTSNADRRAAVGSGAVSMSWGDIEEEQGEREEEGEGGNEGYEGEGGGSTPCSHAASQHARWLLGDDGEYR